MSALRELRERVAAGEWPADFLAVDSETALRAVTTASLYAAFSGSLDAAKTLHEALLPGWGWLKPAAAWKPNSVAVTCPVWREGDPEDPDAGGYPWFAGEDSIPARAWLLAILDALIQKEEDHA